MPSSHFKHYVSNINRIHLVELVERYSLERRARGFRASLINNPITGLPYPDSVPELSASVCAAPG